MRTWTWEKLRARVLARNYLVRPAARALLARVVGEGCGIQGQMMGAAELDVSARVKGLTQEDLRRALWEERVLVKTFGPRTTLHLLPANELPLWMAAMRARGARDAAPWYEALKGKPTKAYALVDAVGEALDGKCLARAELADAVAKKVGAWRARGLRQRGRTAPRRRRHSGARSFLGRPREVA
ncbi:MAG TPA: crosslink repair DNA glycosylase YcaQ family protein [Anaerolineae bacterium]|nr:crosslink repair DNA glycosylase YcaQ family protein [Anaerolineae bacterium]